MEIMMFFRKPPKEEFEYNGRLYSMIGYQRNDDILRRIRKTHCFYEIEMLEFIKSKQLNGEYVDVGANIGNHSIYFANECPATKVYSFECHDKVYDLLIKNCLVNAPGKCAMHKLAITCASTVFVKPAGPDNIGATKIVLTNENGLRQATSARLDDFIATFQNIALIKIDVEGNEFDVLLSAPKIIQKFGPAILIESMWDKFIEVNNFLLSLGYKLSKRFKSDANTYFYEKPC
jgi:FkbM family methyltransferase